MFLFYFWYIVGLLGVFIFGTCSRHMPPVSPEERKLGAWLQVTCPIWFIWIFVFIYTKVIKGLIKDLKGESK